MATAATASVASTTPRDSFGSAVHSSGSSSVAAVAREHKFGLAATVAIVILLIGAASYGVYAFLHRTKPMRFQDFVVTQITNSGKVALAAISPTGGSF